MGTRSSLSVGVSSDPRILIRRLMIIPFYVNHDFMALMFDFKLPDYSGSISVMGSSIRLNSSVSVFSASYFGVIPVLCL